MAGINSCILKVKFNFVLLLSSPLKVEYVSKWNKIFSVGLIYVRIPRML